MSDLDKDKKAFVEGISEIAESLGKFIVDQSSEPVPSDNKEHLVRIELQRGFKTRADAVAWLDRVLTLTDHLKGATRYAVTNE